MSRRRRVVVLRPMKRAMSCLGAAVEHFAEGEEVLLADAQGELAHGVSEDLRQVSLEVAQGVDAKSVDVEAGDDVLVGADQELPADSGSAVHQLLQGVEIADRCHRVGLVRPWRRKYAFCCSSDGHTTASRGGLGMVATSDHGGWAVPVASRHWTGRGGGEYGAVGLPVVREDVPGVVEDDVEDHVQPRRVGGVHQGAQFVVGFCRVRGEAAAPPGKNRGCRSRGNCPGRTEDSSGPG